MKERFLNKMLSSLSLREFLLEIGIYNTVRQSYINHAIDGILYNIRSIKIEYKKNKSKLVKNSLIVELQDLVRNEIKKFKGHRI